MNHFYNKQLFLFKKKNFRAIRERQTVIYVQLRDACGDLLSSSIAATQPTSQALLPHQEPHSHLEQAMPTSDVQAFVISPDGSTVEVTMTYDLTTISKKTQ